METKEGRTNRRHAAIAHTSLLRNQDIHIHMTLILKKNKLVTMLLNYQPLVSPRASIFHELI